MQSHFNETRVGLAYLGEGVEERVGEVVEEGRGGVGVRRVREESVFVDVLGVGKLARGRKREGGGRGDGPILLIRESCGRGEYGRGEGDVLGVQGNAGDWGKESREGY